MIELLTESLTETIQHSDFRNDVGLQVYLYKESPQTADKIYKESDLCIVFEVTQGRVINNNLSANTGTAGECSLEILSDNLRIWVVE